MKKFLITSILVALFATGSTLKAQDNQNDYLGLPGDNLNLYAVMKLFQESKTLEDFERSLNDPNSTINNLDLNGDNLVDYIKVMDNIDGDVHNIVLQVAVSPVQNQDVAVFTVQRFQNGQVMIQLTGDEELYGKNYIVEPNMDDANARETANPGYTGNNSVVNEHYVNYTSYQIGAWPLIRFIFLPSYTIWHSSWSWGYYPSYWHPWRPFSWNYYYGYQYNWNRDYVRNYRRIDYHRYDRWNDFYYSGRRAYSPEVNHRIEAGYYKNTYSHPEQRREGESVFAKNHPEQYRRSSAVSNSSNTRRQTESMINRPVANIQHNNNRDANNRSTAPTSNRSIQNSHPVNNSDANRRSAMPTNNRSMQNTQGGNNPQSNKRQNAPMINKPSQNPSTGNNAVTNRSATNPSMEKNNVTTRSSNTNVTNRSAVNPATHQNAATHKINNQPKRNEGAAVNRKTFKKTETTVKKEDKIKDADHRNK